MIIDSTNDSFTDYGRKSFQSFKVHLQLEIHNVFNLLNTCQHY